MQENTVEQNSPMISRRERAQRPGYASVPNIRKALRLLAADGLSAGDRLDGSRLQMQPSKCSEVRMALRHLGLLDKKYCVTSLCEQLIQASGEQYQALLQLCLKQAYSDLFERLTILPYVNRKLLQESFEQCGYEPVSMQDKMITLLKGLSTEAGMILERRSPLQKADRQTIEDEPLSSKTALIRKEDPAQSETLDSMLTLLLRLPYHCEWTDDDIVWWQQAVAQATTTMMRKVLQAAASHRSCMSCTRVSMRKVAGI